MFDKMIDDLKARAGTQLRLTSLTMVAAVTALVTFAFLCAAGFVYVRQTYGLIEACFAGAGLFFFLTVLLGGYLMALRAAVARRAEAARIAAAKDKGKSLLQVALSDPLVVASGLQLVRAIGMRRLIPLLALGGVALGVWAGANSHRDQGGERKPADDS
jgi:hypothetical protein